MSQSLSMRASRILSKSRSQMYRRTEALKAIAKAVAYLTAGEHHEDATAFRIWYHTRYNRELPNATTRELGSNDEYRERAILYLRGASWDLDAEGNDEKLRSFMMEVQRMMAREDVWKWRERERELEEQEGVFKEVDAWIAKLDEGDEDALDLAVEVTEKYGPHVADELEKEAEAEVLQETAAAERLKSKQRWSRPV